MERRTSIIEVKEIKRRTSQISFLGGSMAEGESTDLTGLQRESGTDSSSEREDNDDVFTLKDTRRVGLTPNHVTELPSQFVTMLGHAEANSTHASDDQKSNSSAGSGRLSTGGASGDEVLPSAKIKANVFKELDEELSL